MADLPFLTTFFVDWQARGMIGDTFDPGFNPDAFRPWCDLMFTPKLVGQDSQEIRIADQDPKLTLLLLPVRARLESGVLKAVRGPAPSTDTPTAGEYEEQDESVGVPLIAETAALELPTNVHLVYQVKFGPMKIDGGEYRYDDLTFAAPTTSTRIDLTTVDRINLPPSTGRDVVLRMVPDDVTLVSPNTIQFWSNGRELGAPLTVEVTGGSGGPGGPVAWADISPRPQFIAAGDTAAAARTEIGAVGNTEVVNAIAAVAGNLQPSDPDLTAIAALPSAANRVPYSTGPSTWSLTEFSPFGRSVAALADAPALRILAGLAIGVNVQAYSSALAALVSTLSALSGSANRMLTYTADTNTWTSISTAAFGRSLLATNSAEAARGTLGALAASLLGAANGVAPLDGNAQIPSAYLPSYVDDIIEATTLAGFPAVGETGKIYTALNAGTPSDPSKIYRWSGSGYVEVSPSPGSTDAVPEGATNLYYTAARANAAADARITAARGVTIQAHSSILAAIAALALVNDNVLQVKGGAVTQRTPAQLKTDLALVKGDVGLGNVDNTNDATKWAATKTLTNTRITRRVVTVTSSATPALNTDNADLATLALAHNVTSFTTNLTGTPAEDDPLLMSITSAASQTIAWGAKFIAGPAQLLTTTGAGKTHELGFRWRSAKSAWVCFASDLIGY